MFKFKLALIVLAGLVVHTPRDWTHLAPFRAQQSPTNLRYGPAMVHGTMKSAAGFNVGGHLS